MLILGLRRISGTLVCLAVTVARGFPLAPVIRSMFFGLTLARYLWSIWHLARLFKIEEMLHPGLSLLTELPTGLRLLSESFYQILLLGELPGQNRLWIP